MSGSHTSDKSAGRSRKLYYYLLIEDENAHVVGKFPIDPSGIPGVRREDGCAAGSDIPSSLRLKFLSGDLQREKNLQGAVGSTGYQSSPGSLDLPTPAPPSTCLPTPAVNVMVSQVITGPYAENRGFSVGTGQNGAVCDPGMASNTAASFSNARPTVQSVSSGSSSLAPAPAVVQNRPARTFQGRKRKAKGQIEASASSSVCSECFPARIVSFQENACNERLPTENSLPQCSPSTSYSLQPSPVQKAVVKKTPRKRKKKSEDEKLTAMLCSIANSVNCVDQRLYDSQTPLPSTQLGNHGVGNYIDGRKEAVCSMSSGNEQPACNRSCHGHGSVLHNVGSKSDSSPTSSADSPKVKHLKNDMVSHTSNEATATGSSGSTNPQVLLDLLSSRNGLTVSTVERRSSAEKTPPSVAISHTSSREVALNNDGSGQSKTSSDCPVQNRIPPVQSFIVPSIPDGDAKFTVEDMCSFDICIYPSQAAQDSGIRTQEEILRIELCGFPFSKNPWKWLIDHQFLPDVPYCQVCSASNQLSIMDHTLGLYSWVCTNDRCRNVQDVHKSPFFSKFRAYSLSDILWVAYHWAFNSTIDETRKDVSLSVHQLASLRKGLQECCSLCVKHLFSKLGGREQNSVIEVDLLKFGRFYILGALDRLSHHSRMKAFLSSGRLKIDAIAEELTLWLKPKSLVVSRNCQFKFVGVNSIEHQDLDPDSLPRKVGLPQNMMDVSCYLTSAISKMFGRFNTSSLAVETVQMFLDELQWREQLGITRINAFWNIVKLMCRQENQIEEPFQPVSLPEKEKDTADVCDDVIIESNTQNVCGGVTNVKRDASDIDDDGGGDVIMESNTQNVCGGVTNVKRDAIDMDDDDVIIESDIPSISDGKLHPSMEDLLKIRTWPLDVFSQQEQEDTEWLEKLEAEQFFVNPALWLSTSGLVTKPSMCVRCEGHNFHLKISSCDETDCYWLCVTHWCRAEIRLDKSDFFADFAFPLKLVMKTLFHFARQTDPDLLIKKHGFEASQLWWIYRRFRKSCSVFLQSANPLGGEGKVVEVIAVKFGSFHILCAMDIESGGVRMKVYEKRGFDPTKLYSELESWISDGTLLTSPFRSLETQRDSVTHRTSQVTTVKNFITSLIQSLFGKFSAENLNIRTIQDFLNEVQWRKMCAPTHSKVFSLMMSHIMPKRAKISQGENRNERHEKSAAKLRLLLMQKLSECDKKQAKEGSKDKESTLRNNKACLAKNMRNKEDGSNQGDSSSSDSDIEILESSVESPDKNTEVENKKASSDTINRVDGKGKTAYRKQTVPQSSVRDSECVNTRISTFKQCKRELHGKQPKLKYKKQKNKPPKHSHPLSMYPKTYSYKCYYCSSIHVGKSKFMSHIMLHVGNQRRSFLSPSFIKESVNQIKLQKQRSYDVTYGNFKLCLHCELVFDDVNKLLSHISSSHIISGSLLSCKICGIQKDSNLQVIQHCEEEHDDVPNILCPTCLDEFTFMDYSEGFFKTQVFCEHVLRHEYSGAAYSCSACDMLFFSSTECVSHQEEEHVNLANLAKANRIQYPVTDEGKCDSPTSTPSYSTEESEEADDVSALSVTLDSSDDSLLQQPENMNCQVSLSSCSSSRVVYGGVHLNETQVDEKMLCRECLCPVDKGHFVVQYTCVCKYSTYCGSAFTSHRQQFHTAAGKTGPSSVSLPSLGVCECGFKTTNGMELASHLVSCGENYCRLVCEDQ